MAITGIEPLSDLLGVANTYHQPEARDEKAQPGPNFLPAHDHLETAEAAAKYLRRIGFRLDDRPSSAQLSTLRRLREAALMLATDRRAYERKSRALLEAARFTLGIDGRLASTRSGWDGLIDNLLVALVELGGHQDRLKRCENRECRWLFIDHSKNRSRHWCESATCGNRQRVRRFRQRATA